MTTTVSSPPSCSPLASVAFPRTGKRGVPQQFPRRLYEMLESETTQGEQSTSPNSRRVIAWSESGKAFRIYDITEFSTNILPKYFRTKKFSSFQRNLNLYGFAKVRRGPESDMYAHPSFMRDHPESLLHLRKISSVAARRRMHSPRMPTDCTNKFRTPSADIKLPTAVSPPSSPLGSRDDGTDASTLPATIQSSTLKVPRLQDWPPQSASGPQLKDPKLPKIVFRSREDRGKLDLLALALEQEAFRESE